MAGRPKFKIGSKWGYLTITEDTGKRDNAGNVTWKCRCICGKYVERTSQSLRGSVKCNSVPSCGCRFSEKRNIGKEYANNKERIKKASDALGQIDGTTMQGLKRVRLNKNNKTGVRGVSYSEKKGVYYAQLSLKGYQYRKEFKDINDAIAYRKWLEETYVDPIIKDYESEHGEYKRDKAARRILKHGSV